MTIKAIQTDKNKKYCALCGTFTIKKGNFCININHMKNKKSLKKKFKKEWIKRDFKLKIL